MDAFPSNQVVLFGARTIPGADVRDLAARLASGLQGLGVGPGSVVAVMMRNEPAYLSTMLAVQKLGAYYVAVNWHFMREDAGFVLADSGARVFIVHADLLGRLSGAIPEGTRLIVVSTPPELRDAYGLDATACEAVPDGAIEWHAWLRQLPPWAGDDLPPLGSIYYTSGSTGRPKGVKRLTGTPEQAQAWHRTRAIATRAFPGFRTAIVGPLYHGGPNTAAVVALNLASLIVMFPRFDAQALLASVHRHRLTHLSLVPVMLIRMLALPEEERARYDLSSLEVVTHGGSKCPPEVKRRAIDWLGPKIVETYGASEVGLVTMITTDEWLEHPGSVGRPFEGTRVRITDADGVMLPNGRVGQIWVDPGRNSLPFTYLNNDAARGAIERDGFVATGDIGTLDDDGYLYITDRARDMVVSGGVNIYPAEIEAVLVDCPGVFDCAVFGVPDAEYGERIAAAIQPAPGAVLRADDVRSFLRERIAGYKVPRRIEFRDALPRDSMGKVFKQRLRDEAGACASPSGDRAIG